MVRLDALPFFMTIVFQLGRFEDLLVLNEAKTGEGPSTPLARRPLWSQDR